LRLLVVIEIEVLEIVVLEVVVIAIVVVVIELVVIEIEVVVVIEVDEMQVVIVVIEVVVSDVMATALVRPWACAGRAAGSAAEPAPYIATAGGGAARGARGVVVGGVEGECHAAPLRTGRGGRRRCCGSRSAQRLHRTPTGVATTDRLATSREQR